MEVQLEATRAALELRMDNARHESRECDTRLELLREANEDQRDLLTRRETERAEWLEEKAQLLSSTADLQASVDDLAGALEATAVYQEEAERRVEQYRELEILLADRLVAGDIDFGIRSGHVAVWIDTDMLFGSSARQMSKRGQDTLEAVARAMRELKGLRLEVVALTDDEGTSEDDSADTLELTTARALTVVRVLGQAGIPLQQMVAAGHADHLAAAGDLPPKRVEIRIKPDYGYLPGVRELEGLAEGAELEGT